MRQLPFWETREGVVVKYLNSVRVNGMHEVNLADHTSDHWSENRGM